MSNDILTLTDFAAPEITIAPSAAKLKEDALALAARVASVEDAIDRDMADEAMRAISPLLKQLEKCRVEVKAPALQVGRDIDNAAKAFAKPLKAELDRLSRATGAFDAAARERERKAKEEALRIAQEARRKEMEEAEARARAEYEASDALRNDAEKTDDPAIAAKLEREAEAREISAERKLAEEAKALDAEIRLEVRSAVQSEVPTGAAVRGTWEYEIVNAKALYNERPECFTLTPVKSEIAKALDETGGELPGISNARKVYKTNIRG